jgi:hypothetical protein
MNTAIWLADPNPSEATLGNLSWYGIPEFVFPVMISLMRLAVYKEATEPRAPIG